MNATAGAGGCGGGGGGGGCGGFADVMDLASHFIVCIEVLKKHKYNRVKYTFNI